MPIRKAEAQWAGDLLKGKGSMKLGSGAFEGPFSFATRMGDQPGTNPEELLGAAHAGCFSMAFAAALGAAGYKPDRVQTSASVHLDKVGEGFRITMIRLVMRAKVPGITAEVFQDIAGKAKATCPVSVALGGVGAIELEATLES